MGVRIGNRIDKIPNAARQHAEVSGVQDIQLV